MYFYVYLRKPPISIFSYANFIIGNWSYLYYLTILLFIESALYLIPFLRKKIVLIILSIGSLASMFFFYNFLSVLGISPYLNPINWLAYFIFGFLFRDFYSNITIKLKYKIISLISFTIIAIVLIIISVVNGINGVYFGIFGVIKSMIIGACIILFSITISEISVPRFLIELGKNSFFIYLWHMPFAGIIAYVGSIGYLNDFALLRPVLIVGLFYLIIVFLKFISKVSLLIPIVRFIGYKER